MEKFELNRTLSKKVYAGKKRYAPKECYNNIYRAVVDHMPLFKNGVWKVAYGYMSIGVFCGELPLLVRHCFIISENGDVIDPTIYAAEDVIEDRAYYTMRVFDTVEEYFSAVEREKYYPALTVGMRQYEILAREWAAQNGFVLCG